MHAQPQLLVGALIDMHLDPLGISSQPAIPLLGSDTILITPFTLLAQAEPDQISFLMVQNFDLKLTPIHRLAENRDIYIAYIIERMKEIVGIEDTTWNAAVILSAQNEKMVFILPPVATCIHNLNSECRPTQAQTCPTITDDQLNCNEQVTSSQKFHANVHTLLQPLPPMTKMEPESGEPTNGNPPIPTKLKASHLYPLPPTYSTFPLKKTPLYPHGHPQKIPQSLRSVATCTTHNFSILLLL